MSANAPVMADPQLLGAGRDLAATAKHAAFLVEDFTTAVMDGRLSADERHQIDLQLTALRNAITSFEEQLPEARA